MVSETGSSRFTDVRWTIEKVNGVTFTGVKSYREAQTGEWSAPEPFMGIMYKNGEFHAVDSRRRAHWEENFAQQDPGLLP